MQKCLERCFRALRILVFNYFFAINGSLRKKVAMNGNDVILINDDHLDPDVAVISDTECDIVNNSQSIDTIVIDEDNPTTDHTDDIIEIIDVKNNSGQDTSLNVFERIVKENGFLAVLIEKCLDMEHSDGMFRVINKSLLPVYDSLPVDYKTSPEFRKLIQAKLTAMEVDPDHKFSHLKDMCETMKCHRYKKRKKVAFVTLTDDKKDKSNNLPEIVQNHETRLVTKRKKKDNPIDNDIIEVPIEYVPDPVIDLDKEQTDVIVLEDSQIIDKENVIESDIQENNNEKNINHHPEFTEVPITNGDLGLNNDNLFLVPQKSKNKNVIAMTEVILKERIKNIENRIASYKKEIEKLEVLEVDIDTINSPYVRCERFKLEVVKMYKELCSLMGAEAVKRREVRLNVTDGRPELPVKNLEKLINDNIGPDGNPHFPDFYDVVECVTQANNDAQLGLNHAQITAEARRLFTNCGLALQRTRKKRDWRNMLGRVDYKLDDDPADVDPVLRARLEENRRVGMKKEVDLLDTFVKMEFSRATKSSKHNGIQVSEDHSDESDDGENESNVPSENIEKVVIENVNDTNSEIMPKISHLFYQEPRIETFTHLEKEEANENICHTNNTLEARFSDVQNIGVINVPIIKQEGYSLENKETNLIETNRELVTDMGNINIEVLNHINSHHVHSIEAIIKQEGNSQENKETNLIETNRELVTDIGNINIEVPNHINSHHVHSIEAIIKQEGNSQENKETNFMETNSETYIVDINSKVQSQINSHQDDRNNNQNVTSMPNNNEEIKIENIKPEPRDTLKDMALFTDNFTATIIYIEDPFLVIEISSDSSDGESDSEQKSDTIEKLK